MAGFLKEKSSCNIFDSKIKRIRYRLYDKNLYAIYRFSRQYLSRNYRFFWPFFISEIPLKEIYFTYKEKRIVFTAPNTMKTMRFFLR